MMTIRKEAIVRIAMAVGVFQAMAFAADSAEPPAGDGGVRQATFRETAAVGEARAAEAMKVTFSRQAAIVDDEVEQSIGVILQMKLTTRRGNELEGSKESTIHTSQRRIITTTEVDQGRIVAVKVQYAVATKEEFEDQAASAASLPRTVIQPVQGKTYICRRESGENGPLVITDEAGNRPPPDEVEIVSQQMQMVGRRNPLAEFLAGRTIGIGDKIDLPNDVASQIFNLGERFGKVNQFALTLKDVRTDNGVRSAIFQAAVVAANNGSTQMRMEVGGPLVVDVASCRPQKIRLDGPIGMSESLGSYSTACQVIGTGHLKMAVASTYRDVRR